MASAKAILSQPPQSLKITGKRSRKSPFSLFPPVQTRFCVPGVSFGWADFVRTNSEDDQGVTSATLASQLARAQLCSPSSGREGRGEGERKSQLWFLLSQSPSIYLTYFAVEK